VSTPTQVAADLAALALATQRKVHTATIAFTAELQAAVQRNASGRPGPNVITGHYRRSINRRTEKRVDGSVGQVGTDAPQARRLEFGFRGTDSRGRSYDQPAFPHFGPALDEVAPKFEAAIAEIATPPKGRVATRGRAVGGTWFT
jgi:hypothetical protein